jgi:hypothetical protein
MKQLLQELTTLYSKLNSHYNEHLINPEQIADVYDDIHEDFQEDVDNLARGLAAMKNLDLESIHNTDNQAYLSGMYDIYTSLLNIENYIADLREIHIQISKKIREINVEIVDEDVIGREQENRFTRRIDRF